MSDPKPQSRFRLASKESSRPTFPVAGPIANHTYLWPTEGGISVDLQYEQALAFEEAIALGELSNAKLTTTGYADPELLQMAEEEANAFTPPPPASKPKKLEFKPASIPIGKAVPGFDAVIPGDFPVTAPRMTATPLRTKFAFGPNPNKPKPAPAPAAPPPQPAPAPTVNVKVAAPPPPQQKAAPVVTKPAPTPSPAPPPKVAAPPAPPPKVAAPPPPAPPKVVKPAAPPPPPPAPPSKPASPTIAVKPPSAPAPAPPPPAPAPQQQPAMAASAGAAAAAVKAAPAVDKPVEKPAEKPVEKAAPAPPAPAPEKPKINVRPAPPTSSRPAVPVRSGNAVPAEMPEPEAAPAPAPAKPKVQPIRPATPAAAETPASPAASGSADISFSLGMPPAESGSNTKRMGIIAAAIVVVAGGGYFLFKGGSSSNSPATASSSSSGPALTISDQTPPNMIIGGGGWATNWGSQESINKGKSISVFRPTMNMPDYRIEFRGQVENKALGWIFRAKDPKNYYVMKIEMIKRGLSPVYALVKYAVINGKENTHTQIMLEGDYRVDTTWRVRQDVRGNKFTTYVQDKLADYWTDDDIKTGGAGFYNDKGEFGQIKLSTFSYLPAVSK